MTQEQNSLANVPNNNAATPLALTGGINFAFDKTDLVAIMEQQLSDQFRAQLRKIGDVLRERVKIDQRFQAAIAKQTQEFVATRFGSDSEELAVLLSALAGLNNGVKPLVRTSHNFVKPLNEYGQALMSADDILGIVVTVDVSDVHNSKKQTANGRLDFNHTEVIPANVVALRNRYQTFRENSTTLIALQNALDAERREMPSILLRVRSTLAKFAYSQSTTGKEALDLVGATNTNNLKETTQQMFADLVLSRPIPEFNEDTTGI